METEIGVDKILKMTRGFMLSKLVLLAHELGVFDLLADDGKTASQAALALRANEEGMKRFLNALVGIGLLVKRDDRYHLPKNLRDYLLPGSPRSIRNYLELTNSMWDVWSRMGDVVRGGKPVVSILDEMESDPEKLKMFTAAMVDRARDATALIPELVDISDRTRLLDVGAGPGTYSFGWMKRYPGLNATLVDMEGVLALAKGYSEQDGVGDRCEFLAGDFLEIDFGERRYDLVLLGNVLQMHGEIECRRIVNKAYELLAPGGLIIVHGFTVEDSETEPLGSTIFALSIAALTRGGGTHKRSAKMRWLAEAGFVNVSTDDIDTVPPTVIWAEKP